MNGGEEWRKESGKDGKENEEVLVEGGGCRDEGGEGGGSGGSSGCLNLTLFGGVVVLAKKKK